MDNYIPKNHVKIGAAYRLSNGVLTTGIWDGNAFVGIKNTYGINHVITERHFDDRGRAKPTRRLK